MGICFRCERVAGHFGFSYGTPTLRYGPRGNFPERFWNICIQVYDETLIDPAR
jgi:hypothetical protein